MEDPLQTSDVLLALPVDARPQVAHLSGPVEASVVLLISELFYV